MQAQVLSVSSTTGWTDWIHGELLLTDDAIIRERTSLVQTLFHGVGPTVDGSTATLVEVDEVFVSAVPGLHRTNFVVKRDEIVSASIRRGVLNGRLLLQLRSGRRVKILWMRHDGAYEVLLPVLQRWLGPQLAQR